MKHKSSSLLLAKYKLEIYHSPLMNTDKNFQPWKHHWNKISLSNTDPISTSVQNTQPPLHGFWQGALPSKFSTDRWKVSVGREGGNSGRASATLFLPIPLCISCLSRQIIIEYCAFISSIPKDTLDFRTSYFRFLKEPLYSFIDFLHLYTQMKILINTSINSAIILLMRYLVIYTQNLCLL